MAAEETQEKGRRAVADIKQWLEATTFVELNWNSYENPRYCQLPLLGDQYKGWDLAGAFLLGERQKVFVENKDYDVPGNLGVDFEEFLANAYSATAHALLHGGDQLIEFFWVGTYPFSLKTWATLGSRDHILAALQRFPEKLGDEEANPDIAALVADRVWLLMYNRKQKGLSLEREELDRVLAHLERKKPTL